MSKPQKGKPDRDIMLAQAEALFAEKGFGTCSLRDVIGAMKCSTTAFYARFESKDDVFVELVRDLLEELATSAASTLADVRNVDEGFERGVNVLVETLIRRKPLVAVALSEGDALDGIREAFRQAFTGLAAMMDGQFQIVGVKDAEGRAWALIGAIYLQVLRWAVYGDIGDDGLAEAVRRAAAPLVV